MASQWREQPRLLPGGCGTGHPARPRGLFRCALAFSPWLRGDDRQISRCPGPAGRICEKLVSREGDKGIAKSASVYSEARVATYLAHQHGCPFWEPRTVHAIT